MHTDRIANYDLFCKSHFVFRHNFLSSFLGSAVSLEYTASILLTSPLVPIWTKVTQWFAVVHPPLLGFFRYQVGGCFVVLSGRQRCRLNTSRDTSLWDTTVTSYLFDSRIVQFQFRREMSCSGKVAEVRSANSRVAWPRSLRGVSVQQGRVQLVTSKGLVGSCCGQLSSWMCPSSRCKRPLNAFFRAYRESHLWYVRVAHLEEEHFRYGIFPGACLRTQHERYRPPAARTPLSILLSASWSRASTCRTCARIGVRSVSLKSDERTTRWCVGHHRNECTGNREMWMCPFDHLFEMWELVSFSLRL